MHFCFVQRNIFCKHGIFLQYIIANMKVQSVVLYSHDIIASCMLLLVLLVSDGITTFYMMFVCIVWLCTFFDRYARLSTATYNFQQPYTTFDGYILLSMGIYYFRRVYTIFNYFHFQLYTSFDTVHYFQLYLTVILQESNTFLQVPRLEFNIILLTLIQLYFFCSSMVSFINFNSPI